MPPPALAPVFGPNDHHLELDAASGRYLPQPGLGAEAEALIRRARGVRPEQVDAAERRASDAERALADQATEIQALRAELAAVHAAKLAVKPAKPTT